MPKKPTPQAAPAAQESEGMDIAAMLTPELIGAVGEGLLTLKEDIGDIAPQIETLARCVLAGNFMQRIPNPQNGAMQTHFDAPGFERAWGYLSGEFAPNPPGSPQESGGKPG
jgi:hypothetical protein